MVNRCEMCGNEFETSRKDAKYCSNKCRKDVSRSTSIVTDNVTLSKPVVPEIFEFTTAMSEPDPTDKRNEVRTAKYWYDIPLAAIPIIKEGWPEMPDFMNGRQYFLWLKNKFLVENGSPVIFNPFPVYDKVQYFQAGDNSRRWGA